MILIFNCGCKYPRSYFPAKPGQRIKCPVHGEFADWREMTCLDCKEVFLIPSGHGLPLRCPECRDKRALMLGRAAGRRCWAKKNGGKSVNVRRPKSPAVIVRQPVRKHDCWNYDVCLTNKAHKNKVLDCTDCPFYERKSPTFDHMQTMYGSDSCSLSLDRRVNV